jgi:hypothetical protein
MAQGAFGSLPQSRRGKRPLTPEEQELLRRQGIAQDDPAGFLSSGMPELSDDMLGGSEVAPGKGAFATEEPKGGGALAGMKPKRGMGDTFSLLGATFADISSGLGGQGLHHVNDFEDRRTAHEQQADMEGLLDGMDLTDEELGLRKAGMGKDVLAQRLKDKRDDSVYARTVADKRADMGTQHTWDNEGREDTQAHDNSQLDRSLGQDQNQFDATMGFNESELGQRDRHHKDDLGLGYAELDSAEKVAAAKAAKTGNFSGAQIMSAYQKNMSFVNEQEKALADMEQVAAASQAFLDTSKDFGSVGPGIDKAIGRFGSWMAGGEINELERHTKAISAMMKKPGGGAWTNADQEVAESYVVNASNTPETNKYAALTANNLATRQRNYVSFLQDSVDSDDPTSLQTARQYWNEYAREVPLFDVKTGQPKDPATLPDFDDWLKSKMQHEDTAANDFATRAWTSLQGELMKSPQDAAAIIADFDGEMKQPGAARALMERNWGPDAFARFGQ